MTKEEKTILIEQTEQAAFAALFNLSGIVPPREFATRVAGIMFDIEAHSEAERYIAERNARAERAERLCAREHLKNAS